MYAFRVPPVLGGSIDVANIEVMSFVVAASINGQLHRQTKDPPPGTPISRVTFDGAGSGGSRKKRALFRRRS